VSSLTQGTDSELYGELKKGVRFLSKLVNNEIFLLLCSIGLTGVRGG